MLRSKIVFLLLCLALILAMITPAQATIYSWIDAQGVRHYSDTQTHAGAHIATLRDVPGIKTTSGSSSGMPTSSDRVSSDQVAIIRPQPGATITDHGQGVVISVVVGKSPHGSIKKGEKLQYYLDGSALLKSGTTATQLTVKHLSAVRHKLSVALLIKGREVRRTAPVTFTVKREKSSDNSGQKKSRGTQ